MCLAYFKQIMPAHDFKIYEVAQNQFPKDAEECDGYVITGSPAGVYDEFDWIQNLEEFIRTCHQHKIKTLGICFGHQILAKALGGTVIKSDKGWGIGVIKMQLDNKSKWIPSSEAELNSMLYSHQDQVTKLPQNAKLIGGTQFCPIGFFEIEDHIFSMQGHPEFNRHYAKSRYDTRVERIGKATYDKAIESLSLATHEQVIGKWIKSFFEN